MNINGCFSLKDTKGCPMYSDYSVFPSGSLFQDLNSFDSYIEKSAEDDPAFIDYVRNTLGCTEYNGQGLFLTKSVLCGYIMDYSTSKKQCNTNIPPPICKSSVEASLNSFKTLGATICKSKTIKLPDYATNYAKNLMIDDPQKCSLGIEAEVLVYKSINDPTTENPSDPKSQASADTKSEASDSGNHFGSLYFIIGMSLGGALLLIAIIVVAVICMRRKGKDSLNNQDSIDNQSVTMEAVYEYVPNLFDEIHLSVGDQVSVKIKFDDGWAYGMNLETKKEGSFPMACVRPLDEYDSEADTRIKQRLSSLYGFTPDR